MANEVRLIDANALWGEVEKSQRNNPHVDGRVKINHRQEHDHFLKMIFDAPTVDAVEASRLGDLGRLMMPYKGCPRGRMGARGDGRIIELDPIKDVEGDIWVPVLEKDLNFLKAKAVEVVRCKDCKHYGWEQEPCHGRTQRFCRLHKGLVVVDRETFCSYGERKDNAEK